jgi:hypothetical protein
MNFRAAAIHIAVAAAIGALIAMFSPAKWLAASLWTSAAMFSNGALATVEDEQPGGFDHSDGSATSESLGAGKFALQAFAITLALAGLGFLVQFA